MTGPLNLIIIPGLGGSDEFHWQSHWHRKFPQAIVLEQDDWDQPQLNAWMKKLDDQVVSLDSPCLFIAHSVGVALAAHWVDRCYNTLVKGAMLVAPADVESPQHTPEEVRSFAPVPLSRFPMPSVVVTSENDPYVSLDRARYFADHWGSEWVNAGRLGHINTSSKLKYWLQGQDILHQLILRALDS